MVNSLSVRPITNDRGSEVFLPFDLELCYAAAIHLTMGTTLFPPENETESYSHLAYQILDEMISRGNKVAVIRKSELERLEGLFQILTERVRQEGLQTLTNPRLGEPPTGIEEQIPAIGLEQAPKDIGSLPPVDEQTSADLDLLSDIGISSFEFWSIISQITTADPVGCLEAEAGWFEDGSATGSFD